MDDKELQALRNARMQELKNGNGEESAEQKKQNEMRASMLPQLLTQSARERLNRIRIVKPERATKVEELIIRMAQTGQLQQKLDEPSLVKLLDQLTQHEQPANKLKFSRIELDSDEDDLQFESSLKKPQQNDDSDDDFFD